MNWKKINPQILGMFPFPFSFLLLPYVENWEDHIDNVLKLDLEHIPQEWSFIKSLVDGDLEKTLEYVDLIQDKEIRNYNKSVLTNRLYKVEDDHLSVLQKLYFGDFNVETSHIKRDDILAFIYFLQGEKVLNNNDNEAIKMFDEALKLIKGKSPIFQAQILLKKAKLLMDKKGVNFAVIALLENVYSILKSTRADVLTAEAEFSLGNAYSSIGNIKEAVNFYQKALNIFKIDKFPYMYALTNNNMGLAYLSIPATDIEDQMRLAYGIQCLKNALKIFTEDRYPDEWASTSLNYANALQYLPTANPIKNLIEAVNIYQKIAQYRKQKGDEVGYARTIANMGNALAHLGKLEEAKVYLKEALLIFTKYGMKEEVQAIKEIMSEIQTVEVKSNEQ